MTRDEYIKWLKQLDENLKFDGLIDGDKEVDLHEMIFDLCEMLEQQTCEDAISREDALMALTGEWTESRDEILSLAIRRIRTLPSVNPQYTEDEIQKMQELEQAEIQKAYEFGKAETGHWKKMVEVYDLQQNRMLVPYGYDDAKFGNTPVYVCECGCESSKNSRFCPDCGAKMVEPQERSDEE